MSNAQHTGHRFYSFIQTLLPVFLRRYHKFFYHFFIAGLRYPFCVSSRLFYRKIPHSFSTVRNEVGSSQITDKSFFHNSYNIFSDLFCSFFLPSHSAIQTDIVHENLCCPQISINIYIIQTRFCRYVGNYWPYIII